MSNHEGHPFSSEDIMHQHTIPMNEGKNHPKEYFAASAFAASLTYPLWRAAAMMQSGFVVCPLCLTTGPLAGRVLPSSLSCYIDAARPPYKGILGTVFIMSCGRAAIFWGSDVGRVFLQQRNYSGPVSMLLPPLAISSLVQVVTMPIVRAAVSLQNPLCSQRDVPEVLMSLYRQHGLSELWRGTSTGIIKAVPKFSIAVVTKNTMEDIFLPTLDHNKASYNRDRLWHSAYKSCAAGITSAALTNPLDVVRNQMFQSNRGMLQSLSHLYRQSGWKFAFRGLGHNILAISIPIALTLFLTDSFVQAAPILQQEAHTSMRLERRLTKVT